MLDDGAGIDEDLELDEEGAKELLLEVIELELLGASLLDELSKEDEDCSSLLEKLELDCSKFDEEEKVALVCP